MSTKSCPRPTVDLLDSPEVVLRQLEVVRLHPLVEGSHDGQGVVGVFQAQGVAQLVDCHQEQVVTCGRRRKRRRRKRRSRRRVKRRKKLRKRR